MPEDPGDHRDRQHFRHMNDIAHPTGAKDRLEQMQNDVLEWLRGKNGNLDLLADLEQQAGAIAQRFLQRVSVAGFGCNAVEVLHDGVMRYEVHWTHNGASFVGFKQPAPQETPENALLAGCAALLENDWCRGRLS
jgi:hypothetical protein